VRFALADLEKTAVERSWKAGPVGSANTGRVYVIEALTCSHHFKKLREINSAKRPSGFIRRQIAGVKVRFPLQIKFHRRDIEAGFILG